MAKSKQETLTRRMLKRYAVTSSKGFKLRGIDPQDTLGLKEKEARAALAKDVARLDELQEMLYAQDQWGVLLIFQAMDAAGKDGAIAVSYTHLTLPTNREV